MVLMFTEEHMM